MKFQALEKRGLKLSEVGMMWFEIQNVERERLADVKNKRLNT